MLKRDNPSNNLAQQHAENDAAENPLHEATSSGSADTIAAAGAATSSAAHVESDTNARAHDDPSPESMPFARTECGSIVARTNSQPLSSKKAENEEEGGNAGDANGASGGGATGFSAHGIDIQQTPQMFPFQSGEHPRVNRRHTDLGGLWTTLRRASASDDSENEGRSASHDLGPLSLEAADPSSMARTAQQLQEEPTPPLVSWQPNVPQTYLDALWSFKAGTEVSSFGKVENVVRTLVMTVTFTATLLVLCPGLPEMVLGTMLPVLAPALQIFAQCVFPVIAALEAWNAISALVRFAKAPNKNLEKTAELVLALSAAGLTISAVALFLSGASPILVTGLLLGNVGLSTLYHSLQFVHHAYLFLSESSESAGLRSFFLAKAVDHLSSVTASLALATGLVFCFLLPALGIALPPFIVAVTVLTVAAVLLSNLVYRCYRHTNPLNYPITGLEIYGGERRKVSSLPAARTGYYATEGYFPSLIEAALVDQSTPNAGELQNRAYLLQKCREKIDALTARAPLQSEEPSSIQITDSAKHLEKAHRLVRQAKPLLLPTETEADGSAADTTISPRWAAVLAGAAAISPLAERSVAGVRVGRTYQSFFRNLSETQELSEAVEVHCKAAQEAQRQRAEAGDAGGRPSTSRCHQ